MKKITKTTEYWFLKPVLEQNFVKSEHFYIRIKTVGIDEISWGIGYENSFHLVSMVGGELKPELVEKLEKEFQMKRLSIGIME